MIADPAIDVKEIGQGMAADVNRIIGDIDENIRKNEYSDDQLMSHNPDLVRPDAEDYDYYFFSKRTKEMLDDEHRMTEVHFYKDTPKNISGFFQRIVRRMVRFLVLPMAEEQTAFNEKSNESEKMLFRIIREQQKEINSLKNQMKALTKDE